MLTIGRTVEVAINYTIPMPVEKGKTSEREVLSIEQSGGRCCTIGRTFELVFNLRT